MKTHVIYKAPKARVGFTVKFKIDNAMKDGLVCVMKPCEGSVLSSVMEYIVYYSTATNYSYMVFRCNTDYYATVMDDLYLNGWEFTSA